MTVKDLHKSIESWHKTLTSFDEILVEDETVIVRDAAIKRFEYNFELTWKAIKRFAVQENEICNSPKSAFKFNWTEDDDIWLDMVDDRNLTTHTYKEIDSRCNLP